MATMYQEHDGDLADLNGRAVAVVGYGNQGRAHALNLRDSGIDVIVGQRPGASFEHAVADGFEPVPVAEAAARGDVIALLVPDEDMADVYRAEVEPGMEEGDALAFAHGFNIVYGLITPPAGVDVIMVSPKGPGRHVRSEFEAGRGLFALVAVQQDATGAALKTALAYSKAIGCLRACAVETTFIEETEADLFGEQAILCGGITALVKAGFDTLVDAGSRPEVAYFEVFHELSLIVDLMMKGGLTLMRQRISNTAEYGDLTRGPRVISDAVRQEMKTILSEIKSGEFAREWIAEHKACRHNFNALAEKDEQLLIEQVGRQIRGMMKWQVTE